MAEDGGIGTDPKAIIYAARAKKIDGYYDIVLHGDADSVRFHGGRLAAKDLALIVKGQPDYEGQPIRLLSCEAGKKPGGFADQFSKEMGVQVLSANKKTWWQPDGSYEIGDFAGDNSGNMTMSYPK